jgi:L-ascorbate metabolism protein UlaG (beta-lactamase superfamily)
MSMLQRAKKSGAKFLNPVETQVGGFRMALKLLPLYLSNHEETEPRRPLGPFTTDPRVYETPPPTGLRITWFGHSCLLLELDGLNILIDPIWDLRASPLSFLGPRRFFPPTIPLDQLPRLDLVLLSHDHYDHLGAETIRTLARQRPDLRWACPLAVGPVLSGFGAPAARITELDWTEALELPGGLTVTALPSRHFSGRRISNRFETLWASFVLAGPRHKVFYGADSGLWDGFTTIGQEYGPFDLILLEIGAFHPLWSDIHMGPDGAVQAFEALGGGVFMPIHWGLFNLAMHAWRQPIERVHALAAERSLKLFSPEPGRPQDFHKQEEHRSIWWSEDPPPA